MPNTADVGPKLGHLTRVHHHEAVGKVPDERDVVGDEDHGEPEAILQVLDLAHERALGHDVESRGGLVHDHELRA